MNEIDWDMHLLELSSQGYYCAQILLLLALEDKGESNEALVRTMGGLSGGLGFAGKNCGALTGGACLLAYFSEGLDGGGLSGETQVLISEFVRWFEETIGAAYGGIDCDNILAGETGGQLTRCAPVVRQVYEHCMQLLSEQGEGL